MNRRLLVSVLAVFILVIGSVSIVSAYTVLNTAAAIRAEGQIPFTPGPLLDNFNAGSTVNAWNCATGTFAKKDTSASCTATYVSDPAIAYGGTGRSLQLKYNVNETDSYAGYSSQLISVALIPGNLTSPVAYTALSFYVRGAAVNGGEFFKIQLKNNSTTLLPYKTTQYYRNTASVYITDYLDGGVTTTWKKVTIPLDNFVNLDGWTSMKEFVIVFENSQSITNASATSGTIYIDDITFENTPISAVRIDHFGDKIDTCALGGGIGAGGGNGGTILPASKPTPIFEAVSGASSTEHPPLYPLYNNVMRLNYDVNSGYAFAFVIFGGGQDIDPDPATNQSGWIAIPHDFSAYNYLYLTIRGAIGGNPKLMKIELDDGGSNVKIVRITRITTDFQGYRIPLGEFLDSITNAANLNKATIRKLNFVFEGDWIGGEVGNKAGTVYIDSVQFEQ